MLAAAAAVAAEVVYINLHLLQIMVMAGMVEPLEAASILPLYIMIYRLHQDLMVTLVSNMALAAAEAAAVETVTLTVTLTLICPAQHLSPPLVVARALLVLQGSYLLLGWNE
jgi:hypothetical protein